MTSCYGHYEKELLAGFLGVLDRLSYQRRIEKLSSWGYSRGRKGFLGGTRQMHQTMSIGGGLDLATSTLTSLTQNIRDALNPVLEPLLWVGR